MKQVRVNFSLQDKTLAEVMEHLVILIDKYGKDAKVVFSFDDGLYIDLLVNERQIYE